MKRSKSREKRAEGIKFKGFDRPMCPDCGAYLCKDGGTWVCDHCGYWDYDWDEICHECPEYGTEHCPYELWLETNPGSLEAWLSKKRV